MAKRLSEMEDLLPKPDINLIYGGREDTPYALTQRSS